MIRRFNSRLGRSLHGAGLLLCLASLSCGGESPAGAGSSPTSGGTPSGAIHLLTINRLQGLAEGVPCNTDVIPTLAGAASLRDELAAAGDLALLACIGETTSRTKTQLGRQADRISLLTRAENILEAMAVGGVDIWVPGHVDLMFGADQVLDHAAKLGITVIMSNAEFEARDDVLPYKVFEAGGPSIAVIGILPSKVSGLTGGLKSTYEGITMLNVLNTVRRLSEEIRARGEADFIAVLSNVSQGTNNKILDVPTVDFVFGCQDPASAVARIVRRGGSSYFLSAALGKEVGHSTIEVVGGKLEFADLSPRHELADQIVHDEDWIGRLAELYGVQDYEALAPLVAPENPQQFLDRATLIGPNREALALMNDYHESYVDHQVAQLPPVNLDHPVNRVLARVGAEIDAALAGADLPPPRRDLNEPRVPTPTDCQSCHAEQYDFWAATDHARAYEPVVAVGRANDVSCRTCHTTGYGITGGYNDVRLGDPLGGVSCYACHEVSTLHVRSPRYVMQPTYRSSAVENVLCISCHSDRRSPGFDEQLWIGQVTCPPMNLGEPALIQARERAIRAITGRTEAGEATEQDAWFEARARARLGQERGVQMLVELGTRNTTNATQAIQISRDLDQMRRSTEAIAVLREFLRHNPGDEDANLAYLELLCFPTNETARDAEEAIRRCRFLVPENQDQEQEKAAIDVRLYEVDALYLLGRTEKADAMLRWLINWQGEDPRIRERVWRWWSQDR